MDVLMQVPRAAPKLVQFSEIGKHCSRLAVKNATVHAMIRAIMIHEVMENVFVSKILVSRSAHPDIFI